MILKNMGRSDATVCGVPVYGDKDVWWVDMVHEFWWWIRDCVWALRYRFVRKHQHHIIRLGIKPRYCDPRWKIVLAMKIILEQYVQEYGGLDEYALYVEQLRGMHDCSEQFKREQEILSIYQWFSQIREEDSEDEGEQFEETQKMLHRLIDVRGSLWT